jgi:DNA-binding winged helix-turn-helix (wHTH) protein
VEVRWSAFSASKSTGSAELRGADGTSIKVRPKTFEVLCLLVSNTGRVVTKQELMDAVWPNVHVSDDSLFQCIKNCARPLVMPTAI